MDHFVYRNEKTSQISFLSGASAAAVSGWPATDV